MIPRSLLSVAKGILKKGIGTPVEFMGSSLRLSRSEIVLEAATQERRAAELLEHRAAGFNVPAGTRHLGELLKDTQRGGLEEAISLAASPNLPGKARIFRGEGIQGPLHWFDPPNMLESTRQAHNQFAGRWFTGDPHLALGYAAKGQTGLHMRRGLQGLDVPEGFRALEKQRDMWGSLSYADVDLSLARASRAGPTSPLEEGAIPREMGFGPDVDIAPRPLYSGQALSGATTQTQARVMASVAASKRARAAMLEAHAMPPYSGDYSKSIRRHSSARRGLPTRSSAPTRFPANTRYSQMD